jgi:signal transduction histidine kinase
MKEPAVFKLLFSALLLALWPGVGWAASVSPQGLIERAYQYLEQDRVDSAQWFFQSALQQAEQKKQQALRIRAGLGLVETYVYRGDYARAKDQLSNCLDWAKKHAERSLWLQTQLKLAELHFLESDVSTAQSTLRQLEQRADPLRDQLILAQAYNLWAKVWSQQNQLQKANAYLKKGKTLASQVPNKSLAIELLTQLATNYKNQEGALLQAQEYLEELIQLRSKTGDTRNLIADHQELADLLQQTGDYPAAQAQRLKALKLAQNVQDSLQQMELLYSIGQTYWQQGQYRTAENYFQRALNLATEKKNTFKTAEIQRQLGHIQKQYRNPVAAQNWYRQSLAGFLTLGNYLEVGRTLTLFQHVDSLRRARQFFTQALQFKMANQETLGEVEARLELAKVQVELKDGAGALRSLSPAIALAQNAGSRQQLLAVWQLLAHAQALQKNYSAAYSYAERYQNLKDSLFTTEQTRIISEMNARFDNAALRDSLQMAEIARNRAELRQKNLLNYLLIGALLAGGLITFLLFQNYRSRQEQRLQAQQMLALEKQREAEQLRSMIAGEEQERKRIAQELHDGLGTLLATVKIQFNAVQNERPDIEAVKAYQKADKLLDEACTEVRKISYNLMPAILQQYGLEYALQDLCEDINRSGPLEVSFIPFGLEHKFEDQMAISVYRIVQELVKNTLKHAEASELIVQVSAEDGLLSIVVEDDGQGFDVAEKREHPGIGLQSIQSRLTLLHGKMDIVSQAGLGSTFTIEIPLNS